MNNFNCLHCCCRPHSTRGAGPSLGKVKASAAPGTLCGTLLVRRSSSFAATLWAFPLTPTSAHCWATCLWSSASMSATWISVSTGAAADWCRKHTQSVGRKIIPFLFQKSAAWAACVSVSWNCPPSQSQSAMAALWVQTQPEPAQPTMHCSTSKSWREESDVIYLSLYSPFHNVVMNLWKKEALFLRNSHDVNYLRFF